MVPFKKTFLYTLFNKCALFLNLIDNHKLTDEQYVRIFRTFILDYFGFDNSSYKYGQTNDEIVTSIICIGFVGVASKHPEYILELSSSWADHIKEFFLKTEVMTQKLWLIPITSKEKVLLNLLAEIDPDFLDLVILAVFVHESKNQILDRLEINLEGLDLKTHPSISLKNKRIVQAKRISKALLDKMYELLKEESY